MTQFRLSEEFLREYPVYSSGDPVYKYKLMIKQHWETGVNYLCITKKDNWMGYKGSGTRWTSLIEKYPSEILTILLYTTESKEDLSVAASVYSEVFEIPNNPDFANLVPELGYEGNQGNFSMWHENADEETLRDMYRRRRDTMMTERSHISHYKFLDPSTEEYAERKSKYDSYISKHSDVMHEKYSNLPYEERLAMNAAARESAAKFWEDRESERFLEYIQNKSEGMKTWYKNLPEEEKKSRSERISKSRLNMPADKKALRGERVSESFKTSPSRLEYNRKMKVDRIGAGNPNAKIYTWFGEEMTAGQFKELVRNQGISKDDIDAAFLDREDCVRPPDDTKVYEILTCPHCNKSSTGKKTSAFCRWHFDNCKQKEKQ